MKKVVLSGKFLNSKINGIPRYAMEVVKHMDPLAEGMDIEICYPTDLAADKIPDLKNIKPVPFGKNGKGWDILCGEKYARRKNALYVNLASRGGLYKNSIVCLHDIRPLTWDLQHGKKTNQFLLDKLNFWLVAHNSKKIVTISEFCRQEIAEYYHLNASDIAVAPEGAEHLNAIVCSEKMLEKGEFYFSIGSMAPHKNFEFLSSSSIWCHPVIFSDIWFPLRKGKIHASTNNNLEYSRFFDAFSPYSVFSVWTAQKEIGGMFRRDAGQNAPLLRHKTKGKSRIMNQNQAKEYYKKLFVNYPDVLSVEEATTLLGFKSQTAIIRRIHQHRIRCLKVGRSFMIPKEYLIDYLLDS